MRSMHKQTVEDQETRPVEKQKKINPFVEKDGLSDAGKLIDSIYQNTNKIWGIIEPVKPKRVKFNESKFVSSKDELNTAGNLMDGLIGATETSKI
ncbi:hypothetical protein HK103_004522 [Boothiomyces macroporosus]|uniref:Uncharacterized protein n=1 Tax=Boothiomyces macroporosus TaxID=261099 RepID=A0AAD5Y3Z8_9FUNG|nr:hypothetical protein HK103_004522 [Boothiomyces macroporosus]